MSLTYIFRSIYIPRRKGQMVPSACATTKTQESESEDSSRGENPSKSLDGQEIPYYRVINFCKAVVEHIFPDELWGSATNKSKIMKSIKLFVKLKKYETLSMHTVMHAIRINEIQWIKSNQLCNCSAGEFRKRSELFHEFALWFFDSFLCALLQSFFYVTETATSKQRLSYFDHAIWQVQTSSEVQQMLANCFTELPSFRPETAVYSQTVRLIPKPGGMRPISKFYVQQQKFVSIQILAFLQVFLTNQSSKAQNTTTTNQSLLPAKCALQLEMVLRNLFHPPLTM